MVGVPGALSALWLRLRALDGLLCRDLGDRLFQHTICLFPGLRLESSNSTALSALDVVSQRLATFVLGTDCRVILACRSRFVTQARKLRISGCHRRDPLPHRGAGGGPPAPSEPRRGPVELGSTARSSLSPPGPINSTSSACHPTFPFLTQDGKDQGRATG